MRLLSLLLICFSSLAQAQTISGIIKDSKNNDPMIGVVIVVKGSGNGTQTDFDGKFSLPYSGNYPVTLSLSFIGYKSTEYTVKQVSNNLIIPLESTTLNLKGVDIAESRISEKQKEAPLTVESMDLIAIKQAPQKSFYESLGTLKGVDLTTASLAFTVINTRGFNSTSPVRSLQLIDGVDNQSPGLNFSLGNFLGAPDLDVLKVDLVAGASTAYYGPNAFNGVISMSTRSPFVQPGLTVEVKAGERNLIQTSLRWAQSFKNKEGKDKFAYKANFFYLRANDWEAQNYDPTPDSRSNRSNPGGYDAVNIYGDEYYSTSDYNNSPAVNKGIMAYYRTGYKEIDIVDYNTENLKANAAFHYKIKNETELILASSFSTGTTVYQGDNRFSLRDIFFYQNRLELRKPDKFFIRAYATNEDAGNSYDAYFTALLLQRAAAPDDRWSFEYRNRWFSLPVRYNARIENFPGLPQPAQFPTYESYLASINPFLLNNYYDSLTLFHNQTRDFVDNLNNVQVDPFYKPGTARFDSAFAAITSRKSFKEGGSGLFDRSALYHAVGEYKFTPSFGDITVGGNFRMYRPNSDGTIFSDTLDRRITNQEYGAYTGIEKKLNDGKYKINLTARLDKNQNFDYLFSPATSLIYTPDKNHILRFSFGSAIRNPTLADQYLYYNVGRAILLGNTSGYDSLLTVPSVRNFFDYNKDKTYLRYFNLDPVAPEQVRTFEVGYRASLFKRLYLDVNYYYSIYKNFIGYTIGVDADVTSTIFGTTEMTINNVYRIASNATDLVNTQGASLGLNYFIGKFYSLNGNWSWNELNKRGSEDPIIPAFNTPRNKFNIGISGRDIETMLFNKIKITNYSFSVNYKWVQGFEFEGSPQFTGAIPAYDLLDAQISKSIPKIKCVFKLGCSNILENLHYEVYGGPLIGRMAYACVLVDLSKK